MSSLESIDGITDWSPLQKAQGQDEVDLDLKTNDSNNSDHLSLFSHSENPGFILTPSPTFEDISAIRKYTFVFLITMTQLLCQAALSQTIIPYHYIASDFDILNNPGEVSWMSSSFSLTVGTFILIFGRIGDLIGYKKIYVISYINLFIWSILAGISKYSESIEFFDVCRGMQGLSFAASFPTGLGLIGHYYPNSKEKTMVFALFGAVAPGGFVIGALWNSLFAQLADWEWIFYVTGIVSLVVALMSFFIIPKNIGTKYEKLSLEMFDALGSCVIVCGLILFNFSWNQGPVVGWDKVYVYVILVIGSLLIISFIFIERRAKYPIVPKLHPKVLMTLGSIAAGWSSFGVWLFYTNRFALDVLHQTPIIAAIQMLPCLFCGLFASFGTGYFINKVPTSLLMLFSMCGFETSILLTGLRPVGQIYWAQKFPSTLVSSIGMDTSFPAGVMVLSQTLPREHQGLAGSLVSTVVNYSISIGLGIAGTVEYYTVKNGASELQGIRNAFYTGMGLAGMGIFVALIFNFYTYHYWRMSQNNKQKDLKVEERAV